MASAGAPDPTGADVVERVKAMSLQEVREVLEKGGKRVVIVEGPNGTSLVRRERQKVVIGGKGNGQVRGSWEEAGGKMQGGVDGVRNGNGGSGGGVRVGLAARWGGVSPSAGKTKGRQAGIVSVFDSK